MRLNKDHDIGKAVETETAKRDRTVEVNFMVLIDSQVLGTEGWRDERIFGCTLRKSERTTEKEKRRNLPDPRTSYRQNPSPSPIPSEGLSVPDWRKPIAN